MSKKCHYFIFLQYYTTLTISSFYVGRFGLLSSSALIKDRFSVGQYKKLSTRKIGLMEVIGKINPIAYRLKLLSHIHTYDVFNVKHLIL